MPANSRWDLIRRLRVNENNQMLKSVISVVGLTVSLYCFYLGGEEVGMDLLVSCQTFCKLHFQYTAVLYLANLRLRQQLSRCVYTRKITNQNHAAG